MRYLFLLLFFASICTAQEITVNNETSKYQYQQSFETSKSNDEVVKNLNRLGYSNIIANENEVSATGSYTDSVTGFIIKIEYLVMIDKSGLLITNFTVMDHNHLAANLENIPYTKKRWVKSINKQLPLIIKALKDGI